MNNRIKRIFIAIHKNRVVFVSTGLSDFVRCMKSISTGVKGYTYYHNKFKNQDTIEHVDMLGEKYTFQKFENKK